MDCLSSPAAGKEGSQLKEEATWAVDKAIGAHAQACQYHKLHGSLPCWIWFCFGPVLPGWSPVPPWGGMNEKGPYRLRYSNTQFPVGGTIWGG